MESGTWGNVTKPNGNRRLRDRRLSRDGRLSRDLGRYLGNLFLDFLRVDADLLEPDLDEVDEPRDPLLGLDSDDGKDNEDNGDDEAVQDNNDVEKDVANGERTFVGLGREVAR